MSPRFEYLDADGVQRYRDALADLERSITYPIGDGADRFFIDHGQRYGGFFEQMGLARFLLVREGDAVLGVMASSRKAVRDARGDTWDALYAGDLKLRSDARGATLGARIFGRGLVAVAGHAELRSVSFAFGALMRGERGDVRRSFRSIVHLGRLMRPVATLRLYFESADALSRLVGDGPSVTGPGLDLSHRLAEGPAVVRNTGRKDFRLLSTGEPWRLAHLTPAPDRWRGGLGIELRAAATQLEPGELLCFGLDERLRGPIAWLGSQGVQTETVCTVVAIPRPLVGWRPLRGSDWVHLSPAEI